MVTQSISQIDYDVKIVSSALLANEGIYPALDVRFSSSSVSADPIIKGKRRRVTESVRTVLKDVMENLQPGALHDADWGFNRDAEKRIAVQALRFVTQSYFLAEPYTDQAGAFVPIENMLNSFEAILNGKHKDATPQALQYKNTLP